ncbi:MAG: hypothetical protein AAF297_04680 [Planctomycetota bacterium]
MRHAREIGLILWACVAAVLCTTAVGCGVSYTPLGASSEEHDVDGTVRTVEADWDDLDAALDRALSVCQIATLTRSGDRRRVEREDRYGSTPYEDFVETSVLWSLTTRDGRPGELQATRSVRGALGTGRGNEITLRVRIGLFGTPSEEACVLDAMEGRLAKLRGPVAVPID